MIKHHLTGPARIAAAGLFAVAVAFPALAFAKVSLSFYPTTATIDPSGYISVGLYVTSTDSPINAISGTVVFPTDKLQALSVDTSDSVAGLWVDQPRISSENGTVTFGGVIFNPGFTGKLGKVFSVRFKALGSGPARVSLSAPQVLANDGNGTSLPVDSDAASVLSIKPISANGMLQVSSADNAGDVLPSALIASSPGTASAVAQALGILLLFLVLLVTAYNSLMIRRVSLTVQAQKRGPSGNDAEHMQKSKKDIK